MKLSIHAPQEVLFEGEAEECRLPGLEEELCVMNFHRTALFHLHRGPVRYAYRDGDRVRKAVLRIRSGIATTDGTRLTLLVDPLKPK